MSILHAYKYLTNQSLLASFTGPPISTAQLDSVSFTAEWSAFAATAGDFYLEVTDDPRWEVDQLRGTSTAKWTKRTIPAVGTPNAFGSVDGTQITVATTNITINANAGQFNLVVQQVPRGGAVRLGYNRSGGGTTAQLQVYASGNGGER